MNCLNLNLRTHECGASTLLLLTVCRTKYLLIRLVDFIHVADAGIRTLFHCRLCLTSSGCPVQVVVRSSSRRAWAPGCLWVAHTPAAPSPPWTPSHCSALCGTPLATLQQHRNTIRNHTVQIISNKSGQHLD